MASPVMALRRWFRSADRSIVHATAPPPHVIDNRPRYRPELLTLEDRNLAGSLLGELIAAALSGAAVHSAALDRLPAGLFAPERVAYRLRVEGPDPEPPPPRVELRGPDEPDGQAWPAGDDQAANVVRVARPADDLLFVAVPATPLANQTEERGSSPQPVSVPDVGPVVGRPVGTSGLLPGSVDVGVPATFLSAGRLGTPTRPPSDSRQPAVQTVAPNETAPTTGPGPSEPIAEPISQYVADLPPNAAPVAPNLTASMTEDGTGVIIDVCGSGTDADGDVLRIDFWDWDAPNGTVFQEPGGKLKYVPFEDFAGTDTFTYRLSDGRDVSNKATVTVTVAPMNDPPQAFNDAYRFVHSPAPYPPWYQVPYYPAEAVDKVSLLANDADVDGEAVRVTAVEVLNYYGQPQQVYPDQFGTIWWTDATYGKVRVESLTGVVSWDGPNGFYGAVDFRYQAADSHPADYTQNGKVSNWADVRLWALSAVGSGGVTAKTDYIAVGDDKTEANVQANDSGGTVSVLAQRPIAKRLTQFGFAGDLKYDPGAAPLDISPGFPYRLYTQNGFAFATATAQMDAVNLELHNSQEKIESVRPVNERDVGAFTVVNTNDTDGDGKLDTEDTLGVRELHGNGQNEKDLMRLRVRKPVGFAETDAITLTVTAGPALIYTSPYREGVGATPVTVGADAFGTLTYVDYWVEVRSPQAAVRGVTVEMKYKGQPETAKATGVWVNYDAATGFHADGRKNRADDADEAIYKTTFESLGKSPDFSLGLSKPVVVVLHDQQQQVQGFRIFFVNPVEHEFTATPAGIDREPVRFDVSRSVEARLWRQKQGQPIGEVGADQGYPVAYPPFREKSNDDPAANCDPVPNLGSHLYSFDASGSRTDLPVGAPNTSNGLARIVSRMNATEFVRVLVHKGDEFTHDGKAGTPGPVQGSRASNFVYWRSWLDYTWDGKWARTANAGNDIYNEVVLGPPPPNEKSLNSPTVQ